MKNILIVYGSNSGNTQNIAKQIGTKLKDYEVKLLEVTKVTKEDIENATNLILGTPTWGMGDLQDDWDIFLPKFKNFELSGKTVALFGLGDSSSYADTFVDGIGLIYEAILNKNCKFTGQTDIAGYSFSDSKALVNGMFVGLPLDEDNEENLTDSRVDEWIKKLDFQ